MKKEEDPYNLRDKSLADLCHWIGGYNETSSGGRAMNFLGQHELKRRLEHPNAIRSWIAIGISGLALFVSLIALGLKIADFSNQPGNVNQSQSTLGTQSTGTE